MRQAGLGWMLVLLLVAFPVVAAAQPRIGSEPAASPQTMTILPSDFALAGTATARLRLVSANLTDTNSQVAFQTKSRQGYQPPVGPQYIPCPALAYHAPHGGPMVEIGALGGGMEAAPFLAHVAMDWVF